MIEFINRVTGTPMWVADNRADEYMAAGHKLAADTAEEPTPQSVPEEKRRKATKKRG